MCTIQLTQRNFDSIVEKEGIVLIGGGRVVWPVPREDEVKRKIGEADAEEAAKGETIAATSAVAS